MCPRIITDFYARFEYDFPLAFHRVVLKPIGHLAVEFFDKGVGFSWRVCRNLGTSFTCADSAMGPFVDTVGTTTPLTDFKKRGITYLATTNARWLPYLADEGVRFVHYSTSRVWRQFGLDQNIPDDFFAIMESPTFVRPFLWHIAFKFWSRRFSAVTIPSSQREDICTTVMHGYW